MQRNGQILSNGTRSSSLCHQESWQSEEDKMRGTRTFSFEIRGILALAPIFVELSALDLLWVERVRLSVPSSMS